MSLRPGLIALCLMICSQAIVQADDQSDQWTLNQIDRLVSAAHAACESNPRLPAYHKLLRQLTTTMEREKLRENADFLRRWPRFVEYVETASLDTRPDHQLGFNVTDKRYFAETRNYVQIPSFLLDPEFLRWASRSETLEKAKHYLTGLNTSREPEQRLTFFSYRSRHLGTPDNNDSFLRLLVVVPGDADQRAPEKWVQFGVTDAGEKNLVRNISVVSALLNGDGSFDSYFKDYYRIYRRGEPIQIKGRWELGYGDDNCAQCHKTGVLPIFAEEHSVAADEEQAVQQVNKRFRSYGRPRFGKYLDEQKFGPGLASADPATRSQRFGSAFVNSPVAGAMICSRCHQEQKLGELNWPLSPKVVRSFIRGGKMPPHQELNASQRNELYTKLLEEYFATDAANPGILKSWLLGNDKSDRHDLRPELAPLGLAQSAN